MNRAGWGAASHDRQKGCRSRDVGAQCQVSSVLGRVRVPWTSWCCRGWGGEVTNQGLYSHPQLYPTCACSCHRASHPHPQTGHQPQVLSCSRLGARLGLILLLFLKIWTLRRSRGRNNQGSCMWNKTLYICFPDEQKAFHPPACFCMRQKMQNTVQ